MANDVREQFILKKHTCTVEKGQLWVLVWFGTIYKNTGFYDENSECICGPFV